MGRPPDDQPEALKAWLAERLLPVWVVDTLSEDGDPADVASSQESLAEENKIIAKVKGPRNA